MNLSQKEWRRLLSVIQHLNDSLDDRAIRTKAGEDLLDLLSADYFASYVWDDRESKFVRPVFLNMSAENLALYEEYYQFHDPITHKMQNYRRAVSVNEVMEQRQLVNTEFFNDFLSADGLYYGINIYVYDNLNRNIGDFRIWRGQSKSNFGSRELEILDMIAPHFRNAMRNIEFSRHQAPNIDIEEIRAYLSDEYALTRRESEVAVALLQGGSDKEICNDLHISLATLRSHISHVFGKTGSTSRTELCWKAMAQR